MFAVLSTHITILFSVLAPLVVTVASAEGSSQQVDPAAFQEEPWDQRCHSARPGKPLPQHFIGRGNVQSSKY